MLNLFNFNSSEYGNLNAEECAELMEKENPVLLDIRSPQEKADGDIPGSILINLFDPNFASQIEQLDRDKTYVVFCRSGNRSKTACSLMAAKGFEKLYNLKGGIFGWNQYQALLNNV